MALMDGKRHRWLNRLVANLNCAINGHSQSVEISRYEETERVRNFRGISLKNLCAIKPVHERIFIAKCACRACGCVFLETRTEIC